MRLLAPARILELEVQVARQMRCLEALMEKLDVTVDDGKVTEAESLIREPVLQRRKTAAALGITPPKDCPPRAFRSYG